MKVVFGKYRKKRLSVLRIVAVLTIALSLLLSLGAVNSFAEDTVTVEVKGLYQQTEARSMLQRINDFRTGRYVDGGESAPWAYNQSGQVDTASYQGLGELQYDYELEKAAMQRAIETALRFSHTRPNNHASDSVLPSGYTAWGENIATGYGSSPSTAIEAFDQWAELKYSYSGQGHRRNMLGRQFNRIGIAFVKMHFNGKLEEGTRPYTYETDIYYWVQVFGSRNDNFGLTQTTALDTSAVRSVDIMRSNVVANNIKLDSNELTMTIGETQDYNDAHCGIRLNDTWPASFKLTWSDGPTSIGTYYVDIEDAYSLSSAQPAVASVSGKTITANSPGTTTLTVSSPFGAEKTVNLTVKGVAKDINDQNIILSNTAFTYNGSNQKPEVTVKDGAITLVEGADYTLINDGGTSVGTYDVVVTGKGNYTGSAQKSFSIAAKKVTMPTAATGLTYTGQLQQGIAASNDYTVANGSAINAGSYTATLTLKDKTNTTWSDGSTTNKEVQWSIAPKSVTESMITLSSTGFTYNGSTQKPSVTVKDGTTTLIEGTDYTLTNNGGTTVGTYNVSITGKGNYKGSAQKSYSITAKKVAVPTAATGLTYTGQTQQGVAATADYTVSNDSATNAGSYTATLTLKDKTNTTWSDGSTTNKEVQWSIAPKSVTESTIMLNPTGFTYNGSIQKPSVTVKDGTTNLIEGTDYTLANAGGTDVGMYTVSITGKGNYSGNTSATFEIAKAQNEITKFEITGGTEGSNPFTITLKAKFGKDTAVYTFSTSEDGDYTSTRPTKKGMYYAKVSIPEADNYLAAESGPVVFTITAASAPVSNPKPIGKVTILNTIANSAKKTNDVIWDKSKVTGATNYVIQWRARGASTWASRTVGDVVRGTTSGLTIKGLYEIKVTPKNATGTGDPSNTVYRYFHTTEKIRLASKSKGSFTMSWKKNPQATSYQVLYTTNKNGSGAAQNIKTAGASATSITVKDIKVNGKTQKLKSGTTYYVQVREMRKVGNTTYVGNISCPVAVKVK